MSIAELTTTECPVTQDSVESPATTIATDLSSSAVETTDTSLPAQEANDDEATPVVTVWSKTETRCVQCDATKRRLDDAHIPYEVFSLEENPDKLQEFKNRGFLGAPVVITAEDTWAGFRPDLLDSTIADWSAAQLLAEGSTEEFLERTEEAHAGDFSGIEENHAG